MKLVIDVSKESYERIKYMYIHNNSTASGFKDIIMEGVPLDGVLDKIRAEIIELRSKQNVGVLECLDVIDKYKGESEE